MALLSGLLLTLFPANAWAEGQLWREGPSKGAIEEDEPLRFNSFSKLAKDLSPAVVSIHVLGPHRPSWMGGTSMGQGSGFIINKKGYILTNAHVVKGASEIRVNLLDGRILPAKKVGVDEATDLALLKVTTKDALPSVPLGSSKKLDVGAWVMAIGNPLGLDHTVTVGIVSAKGRRNLNPGAVDRYENFIQTDASINPGNSGGPLFNIRGEVIGINTAINPHGQGIGFAIPVDMAKTLLPMLASGHVERSWIGVMIQPPSVTNTSIMKSPKGAVIAEVSPGSPAEKGGLKAGDLIVSFNGVEIGSHNELPWLASTAGVGTKAKLGLIRKGKRRELIVTLGRKPGSRATPRAPDPSRKVTPQNLKKRPLPTPPPQLAKDNLGLQVSEITPRRAARLRMTRAVGVVIDGIAPGSPAKGSLIRVGDVIVQVNGAKIRNRKDYERALKKIRARETVRLRLQRGATNLLITFRAR